jgi:hypothetical protein
METYGFHPFLQDVVNFLWHRRKAGLSDSTLDSFGG